MREQDYVLDSIFRNMTGIERLGIHFHMGARTLNVFAVNA